MRFKHNIYIYIYIAEENLKLKFRMVHDSTTILIWNLKSKQIENLFYRVLCYVHTMSKAFLTSQTQLKLFHVHWISHLLFTLPNRNKEQIHFSFNYLFYPHSWHISPLILFDIKLWG